MNERVPTIVLSDIVPTEGLEEDFETSDLGEENDGGNSSYVPSCAPDPILFEPQLDFSIHALKKSAAEGMLDMALLMANASQLKFLILTDGNHRFYWTVMSLLGLSIVLQIYVGICLIVLVRMQILPKINEKLSASRPRLPVYGSTMLNDSVVAAIFLVTILNVIISAFGIDDPVTPRFPRYYDSRNLGNRTVFTT